MFYVYAGRRDLHSFPTRRSSDLPRLFADKVGQGRCTMVQRDPFDYKTSSLQQAPLIRLHSFVVGHRKGLSKDRKSTRLNSSHSSISYAVFCLKKKRSLPSLARSR